MAFIKGQSGNPSGRRKGIKNKSTEEMRGFIQEIIESHFSKRKISADLNALPPKIRLQLFFKLLEFIVPKPSSVAVNEQTSKSNFYDGILQKLKGGIEN